MRARVADALDARRSRRRAPRSSANVDPVPLAAGHGRSCSRSGRAASPRARRRRRARSISASSSPRVPAHLAPPRLGDDAVRADAVAAHGDLHPGLELPLALRRQVAGEVLELEVALRRQRVLVRNSASLWIWPGPKATSTNGKRSKTSSLTDCAQQPPTPDHPLGSSDFSRLASPRWAMNRLSADSRIEQVLNRIRSASARASRLLVARATRACPSCARSRARSSGTRTW